MMRHVEGVGAAIIHIVVVVAIEVAIGSKIVVVECGSDSLSHDIDSSLCDNFLIVGTRHSEFITIGVGRSHRHSRVGTDHLIHLVAPLVGVRFLSACHNWLYCGAVTCRNHVVDACEVDLERVIFNLCGKFTLSESALATVECTHEHEIGLIGRCRGK